MYCCRPNVHAVLVHSYDLFVSNSSYEYDMIVSVCMRSGGSRSKKSWKQSRNKIEPNPRPSDFNICVHDFDIRGFLLSFLRAAARTEYISVEGKAKARAHTRDWEGATRIGLTNEKIHEGDLRVASRPCFEKQLCVTYFSSR